ncbi:hypothetical protein ADK36_24110 [Streptomyces viridochromogenes]|nr:hypothetical protein ADK36_24110 [Streptomyces viridochromogenes]
MPAPPRAAPGSPGVQGMRATMRQAGRVTVRLTVAAAMAFGMYLFVTVLLITAIGTVAVVGTWLLPETVLLVRRIAGAKRRLTTAWTGREIPEAYQAIEGPLTQRLRTAVRDPGTARRCGRAERYGGGRFGPARGPAPGRRARRRRTGVQPGRGADGDRGGAAVRVVSPRPSGGPARALLLGDDTDDGAYCVPSRRDGRQPYDDVAGRTGHAERRPTFRNRKKHHP